MRSSLWQLTMANLRGFYRDPSTMLWTFAFPIVLSIALGIAFRTRPPEPPDVAVAPGAGADALVEALRKDSQITVSMLDPEQARQALRTGKLALLIVAGPPHIYHYDPTRPESRLARALAEDALRNPEGRRAPDVIRDTPVTEPGTRYIDFLIPGLIGLNLMWGALWVVSYSIVEMRTNKLMKRLMATPMRRSDFLSSFLVMRATVLVFELPILLGFAWWMFDIGIRGSIAALALVAVVGSLAFAGIGLLVAARATSMQTVIGLLNLVQLPMYVMGGLFFSATRFPDAMQPVVRALPLTALNDSLRAIMIDGAGLRDVAVSVAIMAAWGIVSFAVALRVFRWR